MDKNTKKRLEDLEAIMNDTTPVSLPEEEIYSDELSDKELLFCDEYSIDRNGTRSAIKVGYPETSARQAAVRLLKKPSVRREIDRRANELMAENGISKQFILTKLLNRGTEIEILMNEAFEIGDVTSLTNTWLKIIDQINKMGGFYTPQVTNVNIYEQPFFPDQTEDVNHTEVK